MVRLQGPAWRVIFALLTNWWEPGDKLSKMLRRASQLYTKYHYYDERLARLFLRPDLIKGTSSCDLVKYESEWYIS